MDLLKKEIDKKRKAIAMVKDITSSEFPQGPGIETYKDSSVTRKQTKTFMKAVDVRKVEEKLHRQWADQSKISTTTSGPSTHIPYENESSNDPSIPTTIANKTKADSTIDSNKSTIDTKSIHEEPPSSPMLKSDPSSSSSNNLHLEIQALTSDQITYELRQLGLPIWVFGERDDLQRRKRLIEARETIQAMAAGISEMDDFRLGSGHGIRNPFLVRKKSHKQDEDEDLLNAGRGGLGLGDTSHPMDHHTQNNLDSHPATAIATKNSQDISTSTAAAAAAITCNIESSLVDEEDQHKKIHGFFKTLLRQWEEELAQRPDSVKRTAAGKNETKTLKQCKDYIRPLLKLCKNRRLEESMLNHILKIVNFCIQGEFVKANDAYMDVAIGRAAWPIGVTMVGIHARSGRARIESSNVAHVMNSEMQRKYLTSVKRLLSYSQKRRTDLPPSKKVLNN